MSVYRDPRSPYWVYEFQFRGRRYKGSTGCEGKRDAERFEREERRRVALGDDIKKSLTLDEAFGLWWEARGRHHASHATERYQLDNLLAGLGKTTALADVGMVDLNHYVARRRAKVSDTSVNREVELLRRVVRYIASLTAYQTPEVDWGQLLFKEPKERVRELSPDEEAALFAKLPADLAAVAEFALLSGQRRTSIITLLWSKVDLAGQRAEVRVKGGGWHSFPLTSRMVAIIANRPKVAAQVFTYECRRTAPPRENRPKRIKGQRYPFSKQGWMRDWRRALVAAGIEDFRFHDLRHTAATRVVRSSGNLKAAQRMLGHTDIATTARYAHVIEDDLRRIMDAAQPMPRSPAKPIRFDRAAGDE